MTSRDRGLKLVDAITRGDVKVTDELLARDVDLDVQIKGDNAIHMAARTGRLWVIKKLKKKGDNLERENINGHRPIHYAARDGYLNIVEYLMGNNVKMNVANKEGNTPLHLAVAVQTMDVIEELVVNYGMDPNKGNKEGQTPLHSAVLFNRQEAIEALIICGANPNIRNKEDKTAADIAKTTHIRDTLKIYTAMKVAMEEGFIKAKGLKITPKLVSNPKIIDRVGIILETIELPAEFYTAFYCRREKSENTTVILDTIEDEKIFSDIFHIKISDVNRDCRAKIYLPLYVPPSETEEMVIRFKNSADKDHVIKEYIERDGIHYCLLETLLVPETTCICVVKVRARTEETHVDSEAHIITSDMEKEFAIEIPEGAFEQKTLLSLQIFDTRKDRLIGRSNGAPTTPMEKYPCGKMVYASAQDNEMYDSDDESSDAENPIDDDEGETKNQDISTITQNTENAEAQSIESHITSDDSATTGSEENITDAMTETERSLLNTNVYQINVFGEQPNKNVTMQIPLLDNTDYDDMVIVNADENKLSNEDSLVFLKTEPKIVDASVIFEVSHFCLYFGTFKSRTLEKEDKVKLQRQISACRDQRQSVTFFAMVRTISAVRNRHSVVVECCRTSKVSKRRKKWMKKGYILHEPEEKSERDIVPDDEFYVDMKGSTELSGDIGAIDRKLKYSAVRSSYKYYEVSLKPGVNDGAATVDILTKSWSIGFETILELPIVLELPPPPPPSRVLTRPKSGRGRTDYQPNRDDLKKNYPTCAQS